MIKIVAFLTLLLAAALALQGVEELNDNNFADKVYSEPKFWLVMFSASWCGHCTHLKPEIEKVAPLLGELGVSVGHVDENNRNLVDKFVVDHTTHMVSYPKLFVFLGEQKMGEVPGGLRSSGQILHWMKNQYGLSGEEL